MITNVRVDRLDAIASQIVSPQQRGFNRGRHVEEWICSTSEALNLLNKKTFSSYLAIKLDIEKVFDTLDWDFLLGFFESFGFL